MNYFKKLQSVYLSKKGIWIGIAIVFFNTYYLDFENKQVINFIALGLVLINLYLNDIIGFKNRNIKS